MLFGTPEFFLFFAAYLALHFALPVRWRLPLIILGSTVFYGWWNPAWVFLPYVLTAIGYLGAAWVDKARDDARRRRLLWAVAAMLAPLAVVKYTNFVANDVVGPLVGWHGKVLDLPLPLGISFVTFTLLAYVIDVYRGVFPREHGPKTLTGMVLFFPHLIAGPILRPSDLLPQLHHPHPGRRKWRLRMIFGGAIFTAGLVKKLVLADPIAAAVDPIFKAAGHPATALDYLLAIYGFAVQIYCDFSGYTDMAIGAALVIGIYLPLNFNRPYAAASVSDFWRRWHITLSSWLRDYLYIPLGGNRLGETRRTVNLLITMTLGGLWHGAAWTFVLWGVVHGTGIATVHWWRRLGLPRMPRWLAVVLTFHFVALAWLPFRAPDMATAWRVLSGPFTAPWGDVTGFLTANGFVLGLMAVFALLHPLDCHRRIRRAAAASPAWLVWPVVLLAWVLALTVSAGNSAKFIYFDF